MVERALPAEASKLQRSTTSKRRWCASSKSGWNTGRAALPPLGNSRQVAELTVAGSAIVLGRTAGAERGFSQQALIGPA
jgi:hypothetical protein